MLTNKLLQYTLYESNSIKQVKFCAVVSKRKCAIAFLIARLLVSFVLFLFLKEHLKIAYVI